MQLACWYSLPFSRVMATNYIGAFSLTKVLLPLLENSPVPSRIVNVTSFTHRAGECFLNYETWKLIVTHKSCLTCDVVAWLLVVMLPIKTVTVLLCSMDWEEKTSHLLHNVNTNNIIYSCVSSSAVVFNQKWDIIIIFLMGFTSDNCFYIVLFLFSAVSDIQVDKETVSGKPFSKFKTYPYAHAYAYSKCKLPVMLTCTW